MASGKENEKEDLSVDKFGTLGGTYFFLHLQECSLIKKFGKVGIYIVLSAVNRFAPASGY